jgi:hypothetical protein
VNSYFYPLKLVLAFLALILAGLLLGGCGATVSVRYQHPRHGGITVILPQEGGLSK